MKVERKKGIDSVKIYHNRGLFFVIIVLFIILIGVMIAIIRLSKPEITNSGNDTSLANPASVYCINHGGNLSIRRDLDGGQYGVCVFDDNSECEEWAYLRGECNVSSLINSTFINGCNTDSDCVPSTCCHPTSCVIKESAPICNAVACTMDCKPGTLDCGQGSCSCVNNKCAALMK
jgi:putative hemolysin